MNITAMIKKVVTIKDMNDKQSVLDDLDCY